MSHSPQLLEENLKPLKKYFEWPGVVELCINQPGEIWIETMDGWEHKKDKNLSFKALIEFAEVLAAYQDQKFSKKIPMLATSLPKYGYRVLVVAYSMVTTKISICIRIAQAQRFDLSNWFETPYPDDLKTEAEPAQYSTNVEIDNPALLKQAVLDSKTIVVAGGTSSGKTTFLNSLIPFIPEETRIITVQDTEELRVEHPNKVELIKSKTASDLAKISYKNIIDSIMRMRPDRIILSELDIENTAAFLRLSNSGHGGTMTTLHTESASRAIEALTMNGILGGLKGGESMVEKFARSAIDLIVHIKRLDRRTFTASITPIDDV